MISQLCSGECKFVVQVFKHGWLVDEDIYFIDMEYCSKNLHDHLMATSNTLQPPKPPGGLTQHVATLNPSPSPIDLNQSLVGNLSHPHRTQTRTDVDIVWNPIGDILDDVVSGLKYIHSKKVVHRDLKPQNGTDIDYSL